MEYGKTKLLRLIEFISKYICFRTGFFYTGISIVNTVTSFALPFLFAKLIDNLVIIKNADVFLRLIIFITLIRIFNIILTYYEKILFSRIKLKSSFNLINDIIHHLQGVSLSYFSGLRIPQFTQKIYNDSNALIFFAVTTPVGLIVNLSIIGFVSTVFYHRNKFVLFILVSIIFLYSVLYIAFKKRISEKFRDAIDSNNKLYAIISESLEKIRFLRTHVIFNFMNNNINKRFQEYYEKELVNNHMTYTYNSLGSIVKLLAEIVVYVYSGIAVIRGEMSIGSLTLLGSYLSMLLDSTNYLLMMSKKYREASVYYHRINEIFAVEKQVAGKWRRLKISSIEVKIDEFKYDENLVLKNKHMKFEKGKIYCLRGKNGRGKSTLINTMIGLYSNEFKGDILYDGYSLTNYDMNNIRKQYFGIMEQETILLSGPISENIVFDRYYTSTTFQELASLFNISYLTKKNYDIDINKSNTYENMLSGGEKQKIALLRTFIKDPQIIILDEPTAALDEETRKRLIQYLHKICYNRIIIIVTHDKKLIEVCDEELII